MTDHIFRCPCSGGNPNLLGRFERVYLTLDNDDAGRAATTALREALGTRAVPVRLPGTKDVAELALRRDGRARFRRAVEAALDGEAALAA